MAGDRDAGARVDLSLLRKILWTGLAGLFAFSLSAVLDEPLKISLGDQLVITVVVGGVTLLVQFLIDFERRLSASVSYQEDGLVELREFVRQGFVQVSEATALVAEIEGSAIPEDSLRQAIRRAGMIDATAKPLLRHLADHEVVRLSENLLAFSSGHELFYDGEDRELLLGLTRKARTSIAATSWATESIHGDGFEAGFWLNDLGGRYLELQRAAIRRGVKIRRVSVYETPELLESPQFKVIKQLQLSAGVDVRMLSGEIPAGGIYDVVLFDDELSYDTTPVTRGASGAPWLLTTRLVFDDELVRERQLYFEALWDAAVPLTARP
jgi:hypothetical protein